MKKSNYILLLIIPSVWILPSSAYADPGDLSDWLYNLSTHIPSIIRLIVAISYVAGFGMLIGALSKLKRCAQSQTMMSSQESVAGPLLHLGIAAVLLFFGAFVQVGSETVFGSDSALAYQTGPTDPNFSRVIAPIILIMRCIGYIAFLKGIFMLAKVGSHNTQPGQFTKALVHIMGGILAINIEATYLVLLNTLQGTPI